MDVIIYEPKFSLTDIKMADLDSSLDLLRIVGKMYKKTAYRGKSVDIETVIANQSQSDISATMKGSSAVTSDTHIYEKRIKNINPDSDLWLMH